MILPIDAWFEPGRLAADQRFLRTTNDDDSFGG